MSTNSNDYLVKPEKNFKLSDCPTLGKPLCKSGKQYRELLTKHVDRLSEVQRIHRASNRYALLIVFQRMDAGRRNIHERKFWKGYMEAYVDCLRATSTDHAPWIVVPAGHKDDARLIVSQIVLDSLDNLKMAYPKTTPKRDRELKGIRKLLVKHQE